MYLIRRTTARPSLVALLIYSVLALLLSWPLLTHITTHVPGVAQWAFDESTFLWNIWYLKHSLIDSLSSPLHSELIWYPLGIDLILYTYNFFHALLALPLALAVNLPFASNIAWLTSTVLSGLGTYLLVRYLLRGGEKARKGEEETGDRRLEIGDRKSRITDHGSRSSQLAAFLDGVVYAFASNRAIYATLGHYDMTTTQWIPFYALMLLRALDEHLSPKQRRKAALLAGIFFAFTGLAEMISALFLAMFTVIVLCTKVWNRDGRRWTVDGGRNNNDSVIRNSQFAISNLLITVFVAFLLWSPVLLPILRQFLSEDFSLKGWGEAIPLSSDLLGWFTPTVLHPLFGSDLVGELQRVRLRAIDLNGTGFRDINTVFLGWATLTLALLGGLIYRRKVTIWSWTALIFGIFTLGPFLQINGQYRFNLDGEEVTFPLPFAILHYLPIIKANRAPNRNSVLLMLGLAVLVGYGVWWLLQRLETGDRRLEIGDHASRITDHGSHTQQFAIRNSQFTISLLLSLFILFEHLALPAPLSDARIPAVYEQIAADPRSVSVMHLPLGWRNSFGVFGPEATILQYYQTEHGKPMLGGNISRAPDFKMAYFEHIPFFQTLTELQFGRAVDPATLDAAQSQALDLMQLYNVGYVILHPPIHSRPPYSDHWQAAWGFVKQRLPLESQPFWSEDGIEAYRVIQPLADDHYRIDLGEVGTFAYRGEGWDSADSASIYDSSAIWAIANYSRLFMPLRGIDPAATYLLAIKVHPFAYPGSQPQRVSAQIGTWVGEQQPLSDDWQRVEWSVPGSVLVDGLNRIELAWAQTAVPRQVLGGNRQIGSTGMELPIDVDITAFADGAWIALFDETGTQIDASAGRAGINLTVLDPTSGDVVAKQGFDTTANQFEETKMAEFLANVRSGQIVLVASKGNASAFLSKIGVDGLRTIGANVSAEMLRGQSFVIVGVKGAALSNASVTIDPQKAFVSVSLEKDRRTLAAAVDWAEVQKK